MSSWVKVGARCVCISSECPNSVVPSTMRPMVGSVYTIRELWFDEDGDLYIGLCEISCNVVCDPDLFRPLITKTQSEDIEMFLRIASKAPSNMESTDA